MFILLSFFSNITTEAYITAQQLLLFVVNMQTFALMLDFHCHCIIVFTWLPYTIDVAKDVCLKCANFIGCEQSVTLTFETVIKAIILIVSAAFSLLTLRVATIHSELATQITSI